MPDTLLYAGIDSDRPLVDEDDIDVEFLHDLVLADSDVSLLYNPAIDGAESRPSDHGAVRCAPTPERPVQDEDLSLFDRTKSASGTSDLGCVCVV